MNEKLQDALAIVEKYGMKGDVIYKEIEALAASKQEPQAQAEPEVVASVYTTYSGEQECDYWGKLPAGRHELITLQSHREAMAKETEAATNAIRRLSDELFQREEAIAKKDAALKALGYAGVEAIGCLRAAEIEGLHEVLAESYDERLKDLVQRRLLYAFELLPSAITQGQEAMK